MKKEKDIPAPIPISSAPFIQTSPKQFIPPSSPKTNPLNHPPAGYIPRNIPLAVDFPLELLSVHDEMKQFYIEDDPSKRTLPSLMPSEFPRTLMDI
ncbi:hypothetical protein Hanom_Chr17g01574801 [Helianthus anomalus]